MDLDTMSLESLEADTDLTHAATKIQASFRGHMARKELEKGKLEGDAPKESLKTEGSKAEAEEELEIDLTDPELAQAATKIQASFRGHMTRKTEKKN